MLNIRNDVHTSTVVTSLNRSSKLASVHGKMNVQDLYAMDAVYKLLNTLCLDLTNSQRRGLISLYNKIAFKSDEICTGVILDSFKQNMPSKFTQNYVDSSDIVRNTNIAYWKAETFETFAQITNELESITSLSKPEVTRAVAEEGLTLNTMGIGRYCLFLNRVNEEPVSVFDSLGNNITTYFDKIYIENLNGTLLVTSDMHISGSTLIKIKINGTN